MKKQITPSPEEEYVFAGFEPANATLVPDIFFDELLAVLSSAEVKAMLYIIRRTLGFKKTTDGISFNQFLNGITTKEGKVLDRGCGIKNRTVLSNALNNLENKWKCITSEKGKDPHGDNAITLYSIRFKSSEVVSNPYHMAIGRGIKSVPPVVSNPYQGGNENVPGVVSNPYPQESVIQDTDSQVTVKQEDTCVSSTFAQPDHGEDADALRTHTPLSDENLPLSEESNAHHLSPHPLTGQYGALHPVVTPELHDTSKLPESQVSATAYAGTNSGAHTAAQHQVENSPNPGGDDPVEQRISPFEATARKQANGISTSNQAIISSVVENSRKDAHEQTSRHALPALADKRPADSGVVLAMDTQEADERQSSSHPDTWLSGGNVRPDVSDNALGCDSDSAPTETPLSRDRGTVAPNRRQGEAYTQPSLMIVPSSSQPHDTPDHIATADTGNAAVENKKPEKPKGPPQMPADDAPWPSAETAVQMLEAKKGRRWSDTTRSQELNVAKKILKIDYEGSPISRAQLEAAIDDMMGWSFWKEHTNVKPMLKYLHKDDKIVNVLDELKQRAARRKTQKTYSKPQSDEVAAFNYVFDAIEEQVNARLEAMPVEEIAWTPQAS